MLPPPTPSPAHPAIRPLSTLGCRVPTKYMNAEERGSPGAETPLLVFINSKSGGRVGPRLLGVLVRSLGEAQVVSTNCQGLAAAHHMPSNPQGLSSSIACDTPLQFDLAKSRPGPVLRTIFDNLLAREAEGDALAAHIRRCTRWNTVHTGRV